MKNEGKDYCPVCGEVIKKILPFPLLDGTGRVKDMTVNIMCACKRKELEEYETKQKKLEEMVGIQWLKRLSLMDAKLSEARLEAFDETDDNSKLLKIIKNYILNFDKMYKENQGLILYGPVGTGKSYAAAVIANELLEKKVQVVMTSFIKILKEVSTFDDSERLQTITNAKLLIIDDLGAERGTDYAIEKVYDIIDSRYRSSKPVILTTNLSIEQMKSCDDIRYSRIYDRIFEMCYPVKVNGFSWRKKEAASRYCEVKKLLEG